MGGNLALWVPPSTLITVPNYSCSSFLISLLLALLLRLFPFPPFPRSLGARVQRRLCLLLLLPPPHRSSRGLPTSRRRQPPWRCAGRRRLPEGSAG